MLLSYCGDTTVICSGNAASSIYQWTFCELIQKYQQTKYDTFVSHGNSLPRGRFGPGSVIFAWSMCSHRYGKKGRSRFLRRRQWGQRYRWCNERYELQLVIVSLSATVSVFHRRPRILWSSYPTPAVHALALPTPIHAGNLSSTIRPSDGCPGQCSH